MTARNLFFWLTHAEADALAALDAQPATWPTFGARTWASLEGKGLVQRDPGAAPSLTDAGMCAASLITVARLVNGGKGQGVACSSAPLAAVR